MAASSHLRVARMAVLIDDFRARFGHHGSHGLAPLEVVRGGLVLGWSLGRAIGLEQDEARGVIILLIDLETRDARFVLAVPGVLECRLQESGDGFRLNVNLNECYIHP